MKEKRLKNVHPGEVLMEEFLGPMGLSRHRFAKEVGISDASVTRIVKGEQRISPEVSLKLAGFFGNSERFWLGLQMDYDIEHIKLRKMSESHD